MTSQYERSILACPHLENLENDLKSGVIPRERERQELEKLGLHGIGGPDGVAVLLCTRCYKKGKFTGEDVNGKTIRLKWPIQLDKLKGKEAVKKG